METVESYDVGQLVDNFNFEATSAVSGSLSDYRGKRVVLFFYPRDNTPGCTQECEDFRDAYQHFVDAGVTLFGASRDTMASHEKFKAKLNLPFELIADPTQALCELFGVMKQKNMYGKRVWGIERSTFIIGPDGTLEAVWRKLKVPGHVDAVLAQIKS